MKKANLKNETGRSMVEMLGVLAIAGVLSVGGVYGYGVAMKKHKANELLHQASMIATTVSAKIMTNDGEIPSQITTFGDSKYGAFSTDVASALDNKGFTLKITGVESGVCGQLEKMAGGMVRQATCNDTTATITYYKNLATTEAEGAKSPTGGKEEEDLSIVDTENDSCPDGYKKVFGPLNSPRCAKTLAGATKECLERHTLIEPTINCAVEYEDVYSCDTCS